MIGLGAFYSLGESSRTDRRENSVQPTPGESILPTGLDEALLDLKKDHVKSL